PFSSYPIPKYHSGWGHLKAVKGGLLKSVGEGPKCPAHASFSPNSTIEIYKLDGQLVERTHCKNQSETIPISHLQPGLYIIKIQSGSKCSNYKIIVTK
ncbi:MAG: T9SS type A sorting domain-containing protein, partial [Bacteroidales bacterium]|nr:T9SS type A sorting domain-containing protein [Bacteroidales bacterium]